MGQRVERNYGSMKWESFHGANLAYLVEQYERYVEDPRSVEASVRTLFERLGPPPFVPTEVVSGEKVEDPALIRKVMTAVELAQRIRTYGHRQARINPLKTEIRPDPRLDPAACGLSEEDLRRMRAEWIWPEAPEGVRTGLEAIAKLREIYTGSLAFEFSHVHDPEEREWLERQVESGAIRPFLPPEKQVDLLKRLIEVEGFERFLHRTFPGQKRFSIEGIDVLVPMLDELIRRSVNDGVKNVMIGMAHRGRLNVLAHVLGKPYEVIFSEFHHSPDKERVPSEGSAGINFGWTGDVKYHLGAEREWEEADRREILYARLTLANNPSHLEFVNPVVEGFARAAQEERGRPGFPEQDVNRALAILIHGDAAFPGEGIVAETLNLSRLRGYSTGGTVHIIANNQLGFTTESSDARSTAYAGDLAKGFEIPVVHVNADDPEACLAAVRLAWAYRCRFRKDFLIDLVGYRRYGHNEMDDPVATQPQMYEQIQKHPSLAAQYARRLEKEGRISREEVERAEKEVEERLRRAYRKMKEDPPDEWAVMEKEAPVPELPEVVTAVEEETLRRLNRELLNKPEGFRRYPKLERILLRRAEALEKEGRVDWSLAETLAYATILADGIAIRMSGQDTERGTFAHRHLVLHDPKTGRSYSPLHLLSQARASFAIYNSPLSEASVLGFEYGYDVFATDTLVLWEAQFGDFANAAQVIIDQFLSSGRAKWGQRSGLVMLLPHGYEGQGPEHSSARLERFLQLAAENNWVVANLTRASQIFHLLRRQALLLGEHAERPLILMTPKSLLRHPQTASPLTDFTEGRFQSVIERPGWRKRADRVERLLLASGKIAVELEEKMEGEKAGERMHLVRVEQLYPFPEEEIRRVVRRFPRLREMVWIQEEPRNMGAWTYVAPRLRAVAPEGIAVCYIGRPERSSPAEGFSEIHDIEQRRILDEATRLTLTYTASKPGGKET
ncbi:2-oxoglutarate dehydrogenase E1 component [Planifilum fimeticola]|uniref:2-oxoglutarate dehydrogenase E1 component n=1 Tax=Planifilum fimeticola TaxID=201975 RepID=UPI003CCBCB9A